MKIFDILKLDKYKNKKILQKLICHNLWIWKEDIYKNLDMEVEDDILKKIDKQYNEIVVEKKPLEYVIWYVEFKWIKFKIDHRALIPRPETEYMIEESVKFLLGLQRPVNVIDVWCWSGVLGLSLYKLAKNKISNLILADISEEALDLAKENKNLIVGDAENIYFYKSDLLLDIPQKFLEKNFIIVANLPYIPDDIFFENVEDNVKKWEPSIAFLWWKDWLDLYRKLLSQLKKYSKKFVSWFFEMMDWQVDILSKEFKIYKFNKKRTFHFNIKIVQILNQY